MTRPGIEPGSPEDRCQQNRFCQEKDSYYRPILSLFISWIFAQYFSQQLSENQ